MSAHFSLITAAIDRNSRLSTWPANSASTASWQGVLRSLRDRGMAPALLGIGDGGLGAWAALTEVFPSTRHQRCW
ncbi:MAG: transposase, partial [Dehalococcoidia bacterium]|nr:transposase [Dehalococcoidia bacterium]